jgi:hypothetical protein
VKDSFHKKGIVKKVLIFVVGIILCILGFLRYDSEEPFVKPVFAKLINPHCAFYKDFLGRTFYRYSYYPTSILIFGPKEKKVQYMWHRIQDINNKKFKIVRVLPEAVINTKNNETQKHCIASDMSNAIYDNYVFPNGDAQSLEKLENFFYKDSQTVYYSNGKILPNADPQTFEVLRSEKCPNESHSFARDADNVYYGSKIIEQADINTFELLCPEPLTINGLRGKDKNYIFRDFEIESRL